VYNFKVKMMSNQTVLLINSAIWYNKVMRSMTYLPRRQTDRRADAAATKH